MNIYLIRHGESAANVDHDVYSELPQNQIPLTHNGLKQAVSAGKIILRNIEASSRCIITSPYERSLTTAMVIAEAIGIADEKIQREILAVEQSFGLANGSTIQLLSSSTPIEKKLLYQEELHYRPPRGESLLDVYVRVGLLIEKYKWFSACESYIIVAHAGVCHMLEAYLTSQVPTTEQDWGNCEIRKYQIELSGSHKASRIDLQ